MSLWELTCSHIYKLTGNTVDDTEGPQTLISLSGCLAPGCVCYKSVTFRASLLYYHLLSQSLYLLFYDTNNTVYSS